MVLPQCSLVGQGLVMAATRDLEYRWTEGGHREGQGEMFPQQTHTGAEKEDEGVENQEPGDR